MYVLFFFQAEDGIRDLVRSRGLGDVYKRQIKSQAEKMVTAFKDENYSDLLDYTYPKILEIAGGKEVLESMVKQMMDGMKADGVFVDSATVCLLYTSDDADERSSVDLVGPRIIKKKKMRINVMVRVMYEIDE